MMVTRLLLLAVLGLSSCVTPDSEDDPSQFSPECRTSIDIKPYIEKQHQCSLMDDDEKSELPLRKTPYSWVPCNKVQWVDQSFEILGDKGHTPIEKLIQSNSSKIGDHDLKHSLYRRYLGPKGLQTLHYIFKNPKKPPQYFGSPHLKSPTIRAVISIVASAQQNLFINVNLLEGLWGIEIARQLKLASQRGVEILFLHNHLSTARPTGQTQNLVKILNEMDASFSNFIMIPAEPHPPLRNSSLPAALQAISPSLSLENLGIPKSGRSDRSKIIIADALAHNKIGVTPKMLISSRDLVSSFNLQSSGETAIISGPAAVVALLHHYPDIYWAFKSANGVYDKGTPHPMRPDDIDHFLKHWLHPMDAMRKKPTPILAAGSTPVQALEVAAQPPDPILTIPAIPKSLTDTQNIDTSILSRLKGAKKSVLIHAYTAYNKSLAKVLSQLISKGVEVKVILDQTNPSQALMNAGLPWMMKEELNRLKEPTEEEQLPVKWLLPLRPYVQLKRSVHPTPENHLKMIIVDEQFSLVGPVNLDSFSWSGGYRSYAVWIDSKNLAKKKARYFRSVWSHDYLVVSHKVWLGLEAPTSDLQSFLYQEYEKYAPHFKKPCSPECLESSVNSVVHGGHDFSKHVMVRKNLSLALESFEENVKISRWRDIQSSCPRPLKEED